MKSYIAKLGIGLGLSSALIGSAVFAELNTPKTTESAPAPGSFITLEKAVTTVNFLPRSSSLSNPDKKALREAMKAIFAEGPNKQVIIAAWGDSKQDKKNVKAGDRDNATQAELAENRGQLLRETLQGLGAQDIDVYNMAENEGQISKVLGAEDEGVKAALKNAQGGGQTSQNASLASQIEAKGGLSKALVIVKPRPTTAAR